ncbi:restriction endonuclease subunit S [Enterobacter hormaechei]|uniref:restriction endonuclease subunit S n=1 Tax=Enterobacter cloacae complex TaxID=354276 RepID=UPI00066975FD|nr:MULTISPECIES: restriction endonuclease subunit S [Enterobacter cloacae complex]HDR2682707.1 restriction endonuclease subunit S [Enterobacter ludwigii]MCE1415189.1 restriction endonuclease subunit S [Enterobacter hormaechei]MCK7127171.1 restriction endonuclease subunit S [Enterobacter kobei]QFQ84767.1 restriction endonuclease subunit S [Enterobacter roggenkampii]RCA23709.1 restriction endonuclease subunit S [Enterobacter hormaechei]
MVPKGWEIKHLSELASKISDGIHKTPLYADTSEIYFINGNNLKSGSIVIQDSTKCVDENDAINHRKDLGVRTLLMSINGTIGNLAYYRGENVVLGKSASYINIKDSVNLDFIYYVLSSSKTQAFYESELTGTTIRNLSIKSIKSTEILTPPLPEQKKIAQILSTWDKAISVTEKLLTNSQQQKKAMMQQLLTGRKRLRDENGVRFSGEWEYTIFGNLGDTYTGLTGKTKEDFGAGKPYIPYINIFKNSRIDIQNLEYVQVNDDERQSVVKYGDIFFTTSSETPEEVGMSSVLLEEVSEVFLNSFCFGFRLNNFETLIPKYARYLFRSEHVRRQISTLGQGATRYNLSKRQLIKLELKLPCVEEQQKIAAVLSAADAEISTLEKKLACLKDEKKALMQQLLTGKRRVKVDEAVAV